MPRAARAWLILAVKVSSTEVAAENAVAVRVAADAGAVAPTSRVPAVRARATTMAAAPRAMVESTE